jgi:hypothetical protein
MRDAGARGLIEDRDAYVEFVEQLDEPFGALEVVAEQSDDRVVCRAEWGGWSWRAGGSDRMTAHKRLSDRLARLDPFYYSDSDWGPPGHQVGELDTAIPPATRDRMRDHTHREARSAVRLLEAVFEAQARRPWAFPPEDAPVEAGIEIEGFVGAAGTLALFPRTFYDIANAFFGRSAPESSEGVSGEHPGLAGALRRLNEKGYMRSDEGRLPHQIHPIEVYVFTASPDAVWWPREMAAARAS